MLALTSKYTKILKYYTANTAMIHSVLHDRLSGHLTTRVLFEANFYFASHFKSMFVTQLRFNRQKGSFLDLKRKAKWF